jgi:hypothetical protein
MDSQVKELVQRYLRKEIERKYIQEVLGIKKRRFLALLKKFRKDPARFSIQYTRETPKKISQAVEHNIIKELKVDKKLIQNKDILLRRYNYSYINDRLGKEYNQKVSLPTIIDRAKKSGFYLKKPQRATHDREVITNYAGELIQHDSSHHLWSPAAQKKWYLITFIDDFSRLMLYAALLEKETTWAHIIALQTVFLKYGLPYSYYVDSHRIFRFWCNNKLIDVQRVKNSDLNIVHF